MKTERVIVFLLFVIFLIFEACIDTRESSPLIVELYISAEPDKFQLFYIPYEAEDGYKNENRVYFTTNPTDTIISFALPIQEIPSRFRVDLGERGYESCIRINRFVFKQGNFNLEIGPETYHRYFLPNIYVRQKGSEFCRFSVNGRYDPFIESSELLNKQLYLEFR